MNKLIVIVWILLGCTPLKSANADTIKYTVYMGSREAGTHMSWTVDDQTYGYYFEFNDRGRGPSLTQIIRLEQGRLVGMEVDGHDYTKNTVHERFTVDGGQVTWQNAGGEGQAAYTGEMYYPSNGTPAGVEHLITILDGKPGKSANIMPVGSLTISSKNRIVLDRHELTLYGVSGLSYAPDYYWLDDTGKLFAVVSPARGISCIRAGYEGLKNRMIERQIGFEDEYFSAIAERNRLRFYGSVAVRDVLLFDSHKGVMIPDKTVVYRDGVITGVFDALPAQFEGQIIDGEGRSLLPGLFDMHVHVDKTDGVLHVAGGVTSVRDMAVQSNYIKDKQKLKTDFESHVLIGPRIVGLCGFIDGNGPFTRDQGIDNVEEGLAEIDKFNEAGLKQIKLYSSIKPEWVEPMATRAHKYGMRVSGHIPAFMTATQAIEQGYDEIQHTNMLFLNFYGDTLDTRNMTRFSAVGERGYTFDFEGDAFNTFTDLLLREEVVIDPTLAIFEWGYRSVAGEPSPTFEGVIHRLPISDQRRFYSGGFSRPPGLHQTYLDSYDRMIAMVYQLHSKGITVVPGTDNLAGFTLHRELELYVDSGIPAAEVLQMATITSATVAGLSDVLGSIEVGKMADMVLVDGNPIENISDIRNVTLTIKDGVVYDPMKLYPAVGVSPD